MKAACVRAAGEAPVYGDMAEPMAGPGDVSVAVTAAALSQVVRSRASGRHYSATGQLPFVVGIDGVGRRDDGRRVYFVLPTPPNGSMAQHTIVPEAHCIALPDDLDDVTAAALANPGMSSWAALTERAHIRPGETVLVNGATGLSGRLAVQIARHLGAKRVIAAGRNEAALREVAMLGADVTIPLSASVDEWEGRFLPHFAAGIDVVLDYLWGASAERLLIAAAKAGPDAVPIRYVQIGSTSGGDIHLPSAVLRSSAITLMGSGIGSIPMDRLIATIAGVLQAATPAGLRIATAPVPLSDVAAAWNAPDDRRRVVFTIGAAA